MWFVLLGIALALVTIAGLYFRRRLLTTLERLGLGARARAIASWTVLWLLFAFPLLAFLSIVYHLVSGEESLPAPPAGLFEILLVFPFWFAVLVVLQSVPWLLFFDLLARLAGHKGKSAARRRIHAIACAAAILTFSLYTPARIARERGLLLKHHYKIESPANLPGPLRIAFFADLQLDHNTDRQRAEQVVQAINDWDPDVVLMGGDWITSGDRFLNAAAETAGALESDLGTYSVRGDHEHFVYRDSERSIREITGALERAGTPMLHNQVRWFDHAGRRIALGFLSYNYIYRSDEAEIRRLLRATEGADVSILLTHQVDKPLMQLAQDRVDLVLAGHTHGGQVNPVVGVAHVSAARVETPYIAGRYRAGSTTIIVTSGIGFSVAPFRYGSPASIEFIEIE